MLDSKFIELQSPDVKAETTVLESRIRIKLGSYYYQFLQKRRRSQSMGCIQAKQTRQTALSSQNHPKHIRKISNCSNSSNLGKHSVLNSKENSNKKQNVTQVTPVVRGEDIIVILNAISTHFLFYSLSQNEKMALLQQMKQYRTEKNTYVFKRGDDGNIFFVVASGTLEIECANKKKLLQQGDSFGELALIYSEPRSVSVFCCTECTLWGLDKQTFKNYLCSIRSKHFARVRAHIEKLPLFHFLTEKEKDRLTFNCHHFKYPAHSTIFETNDSSNALFIILEGRVQLAIPGKPAIEFFRTEIFGEGCLSGHHMRSGTATCIEQTECLVISRSFLHQELKFQSDNILFYCICKWAFKRSPILGFFSKCIIDQIITKGQYKLYHDGQTVLEAYSEHNPRNEVLLICLEGEINCLGVGSIFNENPSQPQEAELIKMGDGHVFVCSYESLQRILSQPYKTAVQKRERVMKTMKKKSRPSILNYFFVKILTQAATHHLVLVADPKKKVHSLQIFPKPFTLQPRTLDWIKILGQIKPHDHIVPVQATFSGSSDFLLVLRGEVTGYSLLDLMKDHNLPEQLCRLYLETLIDIISHLHEDNILHRSIRPDCFFFRKNGQLCAYDMPSMKKLNKKSSVGGRTFTIVGTPHYLAPEMLESRGYSFPADVWSLGVTFYQMCFGFLPFGAHTSNPIEIYQQIRSKPLTFPYHYHNTGGKNLMKAMLCPQQNLRERLETIKEMEYFQTTCLYKTKPKKSSNIPELVKNFHIETADQQPLSNYLSRLKTSEDGALIFQKTK